MSTDLSPKHQAALEQVLGNRISFAQGARAQAAQLVSHHTPVLPHAVCYAQSSDDVQALMRVCHQHAIPVTPRAQGSSLEGHIAPLQGGVSLDLNGLNQILSVNAEDLDCRVQAGVTRKQLNQHLRDKGLFFPLDPGADASLGGMAATRASGTNAVRYGTMREVVLGLSAVMADGSLMHCGTRARKSSAGYDLTRLLVGSEGTLGIITQLDLRLFGIPEAMSAAVCAFASLEGAVEAVQTIIQLDLPVARIELLDTAMMRGINLYSKASYPLAPHLFFEFHGSTASVAEQAETAGEICADFGGQGFNWATKEEERTRLWQARHDAYWASLALRPGCQGLTTDVCVPISQLAASLRSTQDKLAEEGLEATIVGHVGDGNYHTLMLLDPSKPAELEAAKRVNAFMVQQALSVGGTCSGEHGIGFGKMDYLRQEAPTALPFMAMIKRALDPQNILNPGKIIPADLLHA